MISLIKRYFFFFLLLPFFSLEAVEVSVSPSVLEFRDVAPGSTLVIDQIKVTNHNKRAVFYWVATIPVKERSLYRPLPQSVSVKFVKDKLLIPPDSSAVGFDIRLHIPADEIYTNGHWVFYLSVGPTIGVAGVGAGMLVKVYVETEPRRAWAFGVPHSNGRHLSASDFGTGLSGDDFFVVPSEIKFAGRLDSVYIFNGRGKEIQVALWWASAARGARRDNECPITVGLREGLWLVPASNLKIHKGEGVFLYFWRDKHKIAEREESILVLSDGEKKRFVRIGY